jgi:hypothetical protein
MKTYVCKCNSKKISFASVDVWRPTYVKSNTSKIWRSLTDALTPPKKNSSLSTLFQNHKNIGRQPKKQKHNAAAKSVNTGVESDPPGDVKITTNSADAGNANIVVASGGIDPVIKSETHDNVRNAINVAIHNTGNSKINAGDAVEATAATGNHDFDGANTTGVINRTNTTETSLAGVTDAVVNTNINQDGVGAVDVLVQVSVHMRTLFYKYQISSYLMTNFTKPE